MRRGVWPRHPAVKINPTAAAEPPEGRDRRVGDAGEFDTESNHEVPSPKKHANIGGLEAIIRDRAGRLGRVILTSNVELAQKQRSGNEKYQ